MTNILSSDYIEQVVKERLRELTSKAGRASYEKRVRGKTPEEIKQMFSDMGKRGGKAKWDKERAKKLNK